MGKITRLLKTIDKIEQIKKFLKEKDFEFYRKKGCLYFKGLININHKYYSVKENKWYIIKNEEFEIVFKIDSNCRKLPLVYETSKKIPRYYHQFRKGNLCLGSFSEIANLYFQSIKNNDFGLFFKKVIEGYFFRYCCFEKYNKAPWHEYSHNTEGILESYKFIFGLEDEKLTIKCLELIIKNLNPICHCGSGKKFRNCHYKAYFNKLKNIPRRYLVSDYKVICDLYSGKIEDFIAHF